MFVRGERDPWTALGLVLPETESASPSPDWREYSGEYGPYFFVPEGYHGPDRDDPALAARVLDVMMTLARER